MDSVVTSTGSQFVLYCLNTPTNKYSCELTLLSQYGEALWTIRENWISRGGALILRSNDSVMVAKTQCKGNTMNASRISQIININMSGKISKRINTLSKMTDYNVSGYLAKTVNTDKSENLVFVPECLPYFFNNPDKGADPEFLPTTVTVFNPMTGELQQRDFRVGMVKSSLWDDNSRILYISSIVEGNAFARISFDSGKVDCYRYQLQQPENEKYVFITRPAEEIYYKLHCTPVKTQNEDVIFCDSTSTLICMTPDWTERWSTTLSEGVYDMKIKDDNLYIIAYHQDNREAILYRLIIG
jgi:hypothetical protein